VTIAGVALVGVASIPCAVAGADVGVVDTHVCPVGIKGPGGMATEVVVVVVVVSDVVLGLGAATRVGDTARTDAAAHTKSHIVPSAGKCSAFGGHSPECTAKE
jgi:hypothetical protein